MIDLAYFFLKKTSLFLQLETIKNNSVFFLIYYKPIKLFLAFNFLFQF